MVSPLNETQIKANSSFCTFRFTLPIIKASTQRYYYQLLTQLSISQLFVHFIFIPIIQSKNSQR